MRKREIHSIAHWAMMFLLLMFPLLMVGISVFDNSQHETQEVTYSYSYDELQYNENYDLVFSGDNTITGSLSLFGDYIRLYRTNNTEVDLEGYNKALVYIYNNNTTVEIQGNGMTTRYYGVTEIVKINFTFYSYTASNFSGLDNAFKQIHTVSVGDYKSDVNYWTDEFLNLPVNAWYKSLMNTVGVGFTNSSVMNVIYVMPVYILWVFIFDVIVDCFLVIIKLPHKLLNRLSGGENE